MSNPETELAVDDRKSFRTVVGLGMQQNVSDHLTLIRFRGKLNENGLIDELFKAVNEQIEAQELIFTRGTLVGATCDA